MTYQRPLVPEDTDRLGPRYYEAKWRRSFTRAATARVLGEIHQTGPHDILRTWPEDRTAAIITRGAVSPTERAELPSSGLLQFLDLAPRSAASQLFKLATTVDLPRGVNAFVVPLPTNFAAAAFIPEGSPIALRQGSFAGQAVGPVHKLSCLAALSSELNNATGGLAEIIIGRTLEVAVGKGLDAALLSATASSADNPAGILHGVSALTPTAGGGFAAMVADLKQLLAAITTAGIDASTAIFIMSPSQSLPLGLIAVPGTPSPAVRVIVAPYVASGTIVCVAPSALVAVGNGDTPQVDTSKQTTLAFTDPGTPISTVGTPPTVAAPVLDTLQTDTFALKCTANIDWAVASGAVSWLSGATW